MGVVGPVRPRDAARLSSGRFVPRFARPGNLIDVENLTLVLLVVEVNEDTNRLGLLLRQGKSQLLADDGLPRQENPLLQAEEEVLEDFPEVARVFRVLSLKKS